MVLAFGAQQFSTHHLSAVRAQAYFFEMSFPAISRHESIHTLLTCCPKTCFHRIARWISDFKFS